MILESKKRKSITLSTFPLLFDCSNEIRSHLLIGRKTMTKPDLVLKNKDVTLLTKLCIVKTMFFFFFFFRNCILMWELDHEKDWVPKNWCFRIVVLEETLERSLEARSSSRSILKEINPEYSLEGLMRNSNSFLTCWKEPTHWKRPWFWARLKAKWEKAAEDEIVR